MAGVITSEHVDPIARVADRFTPEELDAVIGELDPLWGVICPKDVARYLRAAEVMLHPPADPAPDEADAYHSRGLSFALTADSVSGKTPAATNAAIAAPMAPGSGVAVISISRPRVFASIWDQSRFRETPPITFGTVVSGIGSRSRW